MDTFLRQNVNIMPESVGMFFTFVIGALLGLYLGMEWQRSKDKKRRMARKDVQAFSRRDQLMNQVKNRVSAKVLELELNLFCEEVDLPKDGDRRMLRVYKLAYERQDPEVSILWIEVDLRADHPKPFALALGAEADKHSVVKLVGEKRYQDSQEGADCIMGDVNHALGPEIAEQLETVSLR